MANKLTGQGLSEFVIDKIGTPYVYGAKGSYGPLTQEHVNRLHKSYPDIVDDEYVKKIKEKNLIGKVCTNCSGLPCWYTGKNYGSSQLYSRAYARLPISDWEKFAPGVILWTQGHVGVYVGNGKVIEAYGFNHGTIESEMKASRWKYGLTFDNIDYDIKESIDSSKITYRGVNPYPFPQNATLSKGHKSNYVKWMQWELVESGYDIEIDGSFGPATLNAVKAFQKSCKLVVDGICGPKTRAALKQDIGDTNPFKRPDGVIKKGSKEDEIKWLQWELMQSGYNVLMNGKWSSILERCLRDFQIKNKCPRIGTCEDKTKDILEKVRDEQLWQLFNN